jgi:RLL motif-containing protein 1
VSWLENRLIRLLEINERKPLLDATGDAWHRAFEQYLRDLDCPLLVDDEGADSTYVSAQLPEYLAWLIASATSCAFSDAADDINAKAKVEEETAHGSAAVEAPVSEQVAALIKQLATLCHVEANPAAPLQTLRDVQRVIRQRILPAIHAADAEREQAAAASATSSSSGAASSAASVLAARRARAAPKPMTAAEMLDSETFPLGFDTGNAVLNKAATILRMLYVADLRDLQDAVTDIIITVQEFVADPRTDASLGQVGR